MAIVRDLVLHNLFHGLQHPVSDLEKESKQKALKIPYLPTSVGKCVTLIMSKTYQGKNIEQYLSSHFLTLKVPTICYVVIKSCFIFIVLGCFVTFLSFPSNMIFFVGPSLKLYVFLYCADSKCHSNTFQSNFLLQVRMSI